MNNIVVIIKGFGQIFFQDNILLGVLIVAALGIASPVILLFALLGNISSLVTAHLIGAQKSIIETGIYGFNGILVGVVAHLYLKDFPVAVVVTVILSSVATILFFLLSKNGIPPLAFPFVLMAWIILLLLKFLKLG
jgi:urea transporter